MHVNVTIIGLDRLGASFGLALKRYQEQPGAQHTFTIIGSDPKTQPMKTAQKIGAIDNFHRQVNKAIDGASLIICNVPYGMLERQYAGFGPSLRPGTVVLDTSPLKAPVIELAKRYFPANNAGELLAYLVGITPVVNVSGLYNADFSVEGAQADLFDETEFFVAADTTCPGEALSLAEDVIGLLGGKPRFVDALEHDGLIAATENLPALLGTALFYHLNQSDGWMELRRMVNPTFGLAIQGLRYQTYDDLVGQFTQNRDNLARNLEAFIGVLDQLRDALIDDDPNATEAYLALVKKEWEAWDVKRHSSKWEESAKVETLPGPLGSMGGFLTMRKKAGDEDND
ncbi:MAG: prephenate dehydrogenase/arogenate dehydrogenase family protein [Anaerolineae bacterium]|nr:prephenate dehydrogenase/arogenate dehydrogenase family protein [Anaerolineae bacterium]